MSYILWNGKDSRDIKGLLICELPPIRKPQLRIKETVVDGVDGSIIEELGYESYDKVISVGLKIGANVDEIISFFTGNGEVVFSNEPNKYYIARIVKGIDFARLIKYKVATITFRVQPFKYDHEEAERYETAKSFVVINQGNHTAKPIITITGSGTIILSVNGNTIFQYTFPEGESVVTIDSEKQDAYIGDILKNRYMVGDFPIFASGNNEISLSGEVESIRIKKYSRWL